MWTSLSQEETRAISYSSGWTWVATATVGEQLDLTSPWVRLSERDKPKRVSFNFTRYWSLSRSHKGPFHHKWKSVSSAAIRTLEAQSAGLESTCRQAFLGIVSEVLFPTKVLSWAGALDNQESTIDESDRAKTVMFLWCNPEEIERICGLRSVAAQSSRRGKDCGFSGATLVFAATRDTRVRENQISWRRRTRLVSLINQDLPLDLCYDNCASVSSVCMNEVLDTHFPSSRFAHVISWINSSRFRRSSSSLFDPVRTSST